MTNITLISIPGVPLLTMEMFMTLFYIFFFFSKGDKYLHANMKFPYRFIFAFLCISWFLSSLFSLAGFKSELSNLVKMISEDVLLIWLIWEIIGTKDDFIFLYKGITIVIFGSCIYGFVEYITQSNPLTIYESTLIHDETRSFLGLYSNLDRGYRIKSIFEHAIGAGINWSLYSVFTLWFWVHTKKENRNRFLKFALITAFLCIPCIILTKMRSPLIFLAISSLCLIDFKKKRFYMLIMILFIGGFLVLPLLKENANLFLSLVDQNAQKVVGGSNLDMRITQITSAFNLIKKSPLFGLGNKFSYVLPRSSYVLLYGMESIWIIVIVQFGLFGLIAYLFYFIYSTFFISYKYKNKCIFFITLAYWITYTITSVPGLKMYLFYLIIFYFMKSSNIYKIEELKDKVYGVCITNYRLRIGCIKKEK